MKKLAMGISGMYYFIIIYCDSMDGPFISSATWAVHFFEKW
jgi:hypothetical protein